MRKYEFTRQKRENKRGGEGARESGARPGKCRVGRGKGREKRGQVARISSIRDSSACSRLPMSSGSCSCSVADWVAYQMRHMEM